MQPAFEMACAPILSITEVLDQLTEYVEDLRASGVRELFGAAQFAVPVIAPPAVVQAGARSGAAVRPPPAARPAPRAVPPPVPVELPPELARIVATVAQCKKCSLHKTRTNTVPGQGNPRPALMFVGEAPGEDEDRRGVAFVGRAGQLLTKIIEAMGLTRDEVFIGNILKCRPPGNRKPERAEMDVCLPYLREQIAFLRPKVIVALGATATAGLLNPPPEFMISRVRGKWQDFEGIPLMPTYHPSYLLRNQAAKKDVWIDMQEVLKRLGRTPPCWRGKQMGKEFRQD